MQAISLQVKDSKTATGNSQHGLTNVGHINDLDRGM